MTMISRPSAPCLVRPRHVPGRNAPRVPLLDLDYLVVELHPPAPESDQVHLLLFPVRVAVWKAIARWDALVAQGGLLKSSSALVAQAELQVRCPLEVRGDVRQVLLEVPEHERHSRNPTVPTWLQPPDQCSGMSLEGAVSRTSARRVGRATERLRLRSSRDRRSSARGCDRRARPRELRPPGGDGDARRRACGRRRRSRRDAVPVNLAYPSSTGSSTRASSSPRSTAPAATRR